ncbi:MAG: hypothetical protein DHS20C12_02130 [Pseudohongiella sp.]|nr:MAG: hypothetical protein DHS20C12_02130 [Pseudohongiella sp.]
MAYDTCPAITDDETRLQCYDRYAPQPDIRNRSLFGYGVDGLTSHESNKVLARTDGQDESKFYMDANLSVKYPIFKPVIEAVARQLDIDPDTHTPRLYLAFSTRFSQYLASRNSSPVVARRYNPELFLRVWRDGTRERTNPSYWDFGYGHESNGQRITDLEALRLAEANAISNGDLASSAREQISRGWDYVSVDWNKQWNTPFFPSLEGRTETLIEYRHYLDDGLLQGNPEEYNIWEGDGLGEKPRDYYAGLKLSLQYNLMDKPCSSLVCFNRVKLTQETGYAKPFENNTTNLELSAELLGLPFYIWGRSGYNNDLVDYYKQSNSWGIGLEFVR